MPRTMFKEGKEPMPEDVFLEKLQRLEKRCDKQRRNTIYQDIREEHEFTFELIQRYKAQKEALRESVEYLNSNPKNYIGAGSELHRKMMSANDGGWGY